MFENVIKKLFPIRDENNQPCTFPTFGSQVFGEDEEKRALWQTDKGFYADDSKKLGGKLPSEFLGVNDQAADSAKLGGILPGTFVQQIDNFKPSNGKITLLTTASGTKGGAASEMYFDCYKYGRWVIVNVGFSLNATPAIWTDTVILTGLPPSKNTLQYGTVSAQEDGKAFAIYPDTFGNLKIKAGAISPESGKFYRGQIIYLAPQS